MPPKKNKEQEEAFAGQRIEAESDAQQTETVATGVTPPIDSGKCPGCGRDKVNS